MKIFNAQQVRDWDEYTMKEQEIQSIELMERAAMACFGWLANNNHTQSNFHIFCGKGNNGGDGLALARILIENHIRVSVYILETGKPGSEDFQLNLQRLHLLTSNISFIQNDSVHLSIQSNDIIIDALFGTGLNKPVANLAGWVIEMINSFGAQVIAVDLPSGIFTDQSSKGCTCITATHTLSFGNMKMAFLMPENAEAIGELHLLDIDLSKKFEESTVADAEMTGLILCRQLIKPRKQFSHKGNFGHAALLAGSYGMMGAAVLAARGCLAAGTGKLTCLVPPAGLDILQVAVPEAICSIVDEEEGLEFSHYSSVGIGPGIGTTHEIKKLLLKIFKASSGTLLLDADGLNIMAADKDMMRIIRQGTVITPHPKEFAGLFGHAENDFARLKLAVENAKAYNIYIVLKGHYTAIITPRGKIYFNDTGNAGLAKAGMGDVLTGIITGLLAQNYVLPEAAILGVYLHGLAGDIAAGIFTQHSMQATDLINCLPEAWKKLALGS